MDLEKIQIIKSDDRGVIYDCGSSNFIVRKKGTVSADHVHEDSEVVYLVEGDAELTVDNETQTVQAPIKCSIAPNVYHKLVASQTSSL